MGQKHGIWFDLDTHFAIHQKVLNQYHWLIAESDVHYKIKKHLVEHYDQYCSSVEFNTKNGLYVEIEKWTKVSLENPPRYGMTIEFSYDCFRGDTRAPLVQYHSAHSMSYNSNAPWHDKPHRHEYRDNKQYISVYSFDHRPEAEKKRNYTWSKNGVVILKFLEHENWPFVSEFFEEVSAL